VLRVGEKRHNGAVRRALPALLVIAAAFPASAAATPIPDGPDGGPGDFTGAPFDTRPLRSPTPPRHPFMAPNDRSNLHQDAYQTDTSRGLGPLGHGMTQTSTLKTADCGSVTFDSRGRIVTICVGLVRPTLVVMDPNSLATIEEMPLPLRQPSANPFQDFTGGGYFYLDHRDRAVVATTERRIMVVAGARDVQASYDISGAVRSGDGIISTLPDWSGRIWFATKSGVVGWVDPRTGAVRSRALGEPIGNSFAVDEQNGVYIVTDGALYRLEATANGINTVWREGYANDGQKKPGQTQPGSGTTPTLFGPGLVGITDNADPIRVVVMRRGRSTGGKPRTVCATPVFNRGASSDDQSLIAVNRSLIAENNYGYTGPPSTQFGRTTQPGLERVDVRRDLSGCPKIWRSEERAPSVVPKVSLDGGLVYTYTKPAGDDRDPWYLTALDFRNGRTVWKKLAGFGLGHNNNYAPVTLNPDNGTAYVGTLGGLVALRDRTPPKLPHSPRLRVEARCGNRRVRGRLSGIDEPLVLRARIAVRKRKWTDRSSPFRVRWKLRRTPRRVRVRIVARLRDGRLPRRTKTVRCKR
jgi:hypothetical protein